MAKKFLGWTTVAGVLLAAAACSAADEGAQTGASSAQAKGGQTMVIIETSKGTIKVELEVRNPNLDLRDGVIAQMHIPIEEVTAHLLSPAILTLDENGRIGINSVDAEDIVRFFPITLSGNTFAMNSLQPVSGLLYQWHLTERLSLGGDSGLALFRDSGDHYLQWQQGLDVDYLLTDRIGVFSGWQMTADDGSADDLTRHMLSAGASWLCTDRLQLTWRAGAGMNDPAPDFLTDVRFGFLF